MASFPRASRGLQHLLLKTERKFFGHVLYVTADVAVLFHHEGTATITTLGLNQFSVWHCFGQGCEIRSARKSLDVLNGAGEAGSSSV